MNNTCPDSQTELKEALRLARVGTWYWDATTDAMAGCDELRRIFGLNPDCDMPDFNELRGRSYTEEDWLRIRTAIGRTLDTGAGLELDLRALRNGTKIWITMRGEAVRNSEGQIVGVWGTVQDITVRKGTEVALRESEHNLAAELDIALRLRSLSAALVDGSGAQGLYEQMVDAAMDIMRADLASIQMLETDDSNTSTGGVLRLLAWRGFHPESAKFFELVGSDSNSSCGAALRSRERVIIPDVEKSEAMRGTAGLNELRRSGIRTMQSTPLISRSGHVLGMISTHWRQPCNPPSHMLNVFDLLVRQVADLIERKRAEEALAKAKAIAEDANRQKDFFLAMLGHELRNPLAPIRNSVAVLKRLVPAEPVVRRPLSMIERQVEHMTRLIDDLLDVSRIARGKVTLHKEEMDLADTGRTAVEDYRALLDTAGIVCQFKPPQSPIWIMGDAARLAQVIINLMDNARKFTDRGGCVTLEIGLTATGGAAITVMDTGIGMDKETLARIFDPFSQADRSLDRSRGGLGLGLALVKGLVELHGGTVQANSAGLGHGSEFVVTLPGVIATRHQDRTGPMRTTSGRRRRILVVEDNVDAAESLRNLLELGGHVVEVAKSGKEALLLARTFIPEVVICDIGLPGGMDGYSVAKAMRADLKLCNAFIVAMTGYGQEEDRQSAMEAGFDLHLAKPADPEILEEILQQ